MTLHDPPRIKLPRSVATFAWDWMVGSTMIVTGLIVQLFVCVILMMPIVALLKMSPASERWAHDHEKLAGYGLWLMLMILFNCAAFYDFYRRKTINTAIGTAGSIHLVPRGIHRIRTGQEPSRSR